MKTIKTAALGLITAAVLFGGIGLSMILGLWNVSSTKEPAKIKTGEFSGMPNPADIRGSYTWDDISKAFTIPAPLLVEAFGAAKSSDKVNLLEAAYAGKIPDGMEVGTDSVRLFAALYTGIPFEAEHGTMIPAKAVDVLKKAGKKTPPDAVIFNGVSISPVPPAPAPAAPPAAAAPADTATPAPAAASAANAPAAAATAPSAQSSFTFTGKTTFGDLKNAGFDMKKVEEITGKIPALSTTVKAAAEAQGKEYSEFKEKLTLIIPK